MIFAAKRCLFSPPCPTRLSYTAATPLFPRLTKRTISGLNMTKIVCTLGPSTEAQEQVNRLVESGMGCARLNFSHVKEYSEPKAKFDLVRASTGKHFHLGWTGVPPNLRAVLCDTKGPEIRTGGLPGEVDVLEIRDGMTLVLTHDDVRGDPAWGGSGNGDAGAQARLHIDYESLATTVRVGGSVLLDDGLIALKVVSVDAANKTVTCRALNGGPIKENKGVNLPGATLDLPALTAKDKEDLRWAVSVGCDYIAASFIRSAANVRSCVAFLERCCDEEAARHGARPSRPLVISKIESEEGVENFTEILEASDGIMVARGDLGVEIPFEKVFAAQKMVSGKTLASSFFFFCFLLLSLAVTCLYRSGAHHAHRPLLCAPPLTLGFRISD